MKTVALRREMRFMLNASVFVDTNVLVYSQDPRAPEKQGRAREWLSTLTEFGRCKINLQVVNEFMRWRLKSSPKTDPASLVREAASLRLLGDQGVDWQTMMLAIKARSQFGFQWFDCLLLASALQLQCMFFLSEDMTAGSTFEGLTIINPFQLAPAEFLKENP
jgi:predicted nucleic acid-binding protein